MNQGSKVSKGSKRPTGDSTTDLLSALVEARKRWFDLIASLETAANCQIDEHELEAVIDSDYSGRETLTKEEAQGLLMRVTVRPTWLRRLHTCNR